MRKNLKGCRIVSVVTMCLQKGRKRYTFVVDVNGDNNNYKNRFSLELYSKVL